jgi:hypothetical protein
MKIKPAVKLDLGEMCKLRLLFFVSREYLIAYIYSLIQTRSLVKYVFICCELEKLDVCFHLVMYRQLVYL